MQAIQRSTIGNVSLPPGVPSLEELREGFDVGRASTEQPNPKTERLSQVMHEDVEKGLGLFLDVSEGVAEGVRKAAPQMEEFAKEVAGAKRIFLVGAGSSGRVAVGLEARLQQDRVVSVIVGGDSALIQARESAEDSRVEGKVACQQLGVGEEDLVFLISASGSATFNVNFGQQASESGAQVIYFHNSEEVVERTEKLFDLPNVRRFCVDIGAAAITGSTRLDHADLAEAVLGGLLAGEDLVSKLEEGNQRIRHHLGDIAELVKVGHGVYCNQGYVTGLALPKGGREAVIDGVELKPTYNLRGIREKKESSEKPAPYRVYILGDEGWRAALGREPREEDTDRYILASEDEGPTGYGARPKGAGNLTIGMGRLGNDAISEELIKAIEAVEGEKALIFTMTRALSEEDRVLLKRIPHLVCIDELPEDKVGLVEGICFKRVLNLVSNGPMVLWGKVRGNLMIDVRIANDKLRLRAINLVKNIWKDRMGTDLPWSDEVLHGNTFAVDGKQPVRTLLAMCLNGTNADKAANFLSDQRGPLDWLKG